MIQLPPSAVEGGAVHAVKAGRPSCAPAEMKADLHMHSTFSDGAKTPAELCRMAKKAHVSILSLTDHDTAAGQAELEQAAAACGGLTLIPGVEVSTGADGKVHVLGYGPAVHCDEMSAFLKRTASDRVQRAAKILDLLAAQGIGITQQQRGQLLQNPNVGRPHIARTLVELGVVSTVRQAFDQYLVQGRCAYVARDLPSTAEAIRIMRGLGVVPVLAHPLEMGHDLPTLTALLDEWKACGLMGLEVYHTSANARSARQLDVLGRSMQLLITGGSDYHGDAGSTAHIGRLPSGWNSRAKDIDALLQATHM